MDRIKVIYVAGTGRSGSTLLDRVLGTLDGTTSLNEICYLYRGRIAETRCACGEIFEACPFWTAVASRVFSSPADAARVNALYHGVTHSRAFPKILTGLSDTRFRGQLTEFEDRLRRLYFALAEVSGSDVLVDSSKIPTLPLILSRLPEIDLYVIHIVRDVRAVVHAWRKQKRDPANSGVVGVHQPLRTVRFWYALNVLSEMLSLRAPYYRLFYEDFSQRPREVLQSLVDQLPPTAGKRLNFLTEDTIALGKLHSIGGNPDRFASGVTRIRSDNAWMAQMPADLRRQITMFALPLLARYGYPLSPRARSAAS